MSQCVDCPRLSWTADNPPPEGWTARAVCCCGEFPEFNKLHPNLFAPSTVTVPLLGALMLAGASRLARRTLADERMKAALPDIDITTPSLDPFEGLSRQQRRALARKGRRR